MKDWKRDSNVVHPVWNDGYQRYDLSIDEIIQKIKDSGYDLDYIGPEDPDDPGLDDTVDYILEIHSQNGLVVSPEMALILQPRVYRNGENITAQLDMKYFKWVRTSSDSAGDAEWNLRHSTGIKDLYITHEDVKSRAVFHCALLTGVAETRFVSNMYAAYMASINKE
jgi:hypothetical protein